MNWKIIVFFLLLIVVFGIAGVMMATKKQPQDKYADAEQQQNSGWLRTLEGITGVFQKKVALNRIDAVGGCRMMQNDLEMQDVCQLTVSSKKGSDGHALIIQVPMGYSLKVYNNKHCGKKDPRPVRVVVNGGERTLEADDKARTLLLSFGEKSIPANMAFLESQPQLNCWQWQDKARVKLVLMEEGGRVRINCLACSTQNTSLKLRLN